MEYRSQTPRLSRAGRWSRRRAARPAGRRGVSEVVATILILALTVVLFASLFAFVNSLPPPPPQNVNQFQGSIVLTPNQTYIQGVTLLMTAGPLVAGSAQVYLHSQNHPTLNPFKNPIPVAYGVNNATVWGVGQAWTYTFGATQRPSLPDNITVYIVATGQLLFSATIPGAVPNLPPSITQSGATPSPVAVGGAFQIYAGITGNLTGVAVKVSLGGIPGLTGVPQTMVKSGGLWVYNVSSGLTTKNGTYYAFVNVSNAGGQQTTGSVTVIITGSGGGGSAGFTVSVGMFPQPPPVPQAGATSPTAYFWAVITYPGTKANVPVSVNFTISQLAGGRSSPLTATTVIPGQTGQKITGPSSLTVYSQTPPFGGWVLNSTITVLANATLSGVGSANGTIVFSTANLVQGRIYDTTSSTGSMANDVGSQSHSCTATTCPYLFLTVWDNFTAALGGPATLTFSGTATTNSTCGGCTHTFAIASQTVSAGSTLAVNIVGGTNRWVPNGPPTVGSVFTLRLWLTVQWSGTTIGYIYSTYSVIMT